MNNMKKILIAVIAITSLSVNAFAGSFGFGVAGHLVNISASGTETPGGLNTGVENSVTSASAGNMVGFGTYFAEYNFGGEERFTLGVEVIPGSADVSNKTLSRTDTASGDSNDTAGTKSANAKLDGHTTYYAEFVITNGVYAKVGMAQVDLITNDTSTSGGTDSIYGNQQLDAWTYGIGQKGTYGNGSGFYKIEAYMTDYDSVTLTGTGASTTGTSTNSSLTADLDVVGGTVKVGYKF